MIYRKRSEKLNLVLFLCLFCFVLFFLDNFLSFIDKPVFGVSFSYL